MHLIATLRKQLYIKFVNNRISYFYFKAIVKENTKRKRT